MKFRVISDEKFIGQAILNANDVGMGIYVGRFEPVPSYDDVRPVFLLYTKSAVIREKTGKDDEELLQQFYEENNKLKLTLRRLDGVIIPTSWILIVDFIDEILGDEREIQVQISEPDLMRAPANR